MSDAEFCELREKIASSREGRILVLCNSCGCETCDCEMRRTLAARDAEIAGNKQQREESLKFLQSFDCNWGCGCGSRHCDKDKPCQSCRLSESRSQLAEAREVVRQCQHRIHSDVCGYKCNDECSRAAAWLAKGDELALCAAAEKGERT